MNTKYNETYEEKPTIWLDTIDRNIIESGQLEQLIDAGISGVTSEPATFAHSVQSRSDDNELIHRLDGEGKSPRKMMEAVIFDNIRRTADDLHPVYSRTKGLDGYVSLDIDPRLERDSDEIQAEGLRLAFDVDRVNVMIQIPATPDGLEAMTRPIADGVSVNLTHVYTPETYSAADQAYLEGEVYGRFGDIFQGPTWGTITSLKAGITSLEEDVLVKRNQLAVM